MATPGEKRETNALARDVGQRSVGQLEAGLARIMGETGANNRWLLGALVLLNGGGIAIAASQIAWLDPEALGSAISLFVIGAALAVLAALAGALAAQLLSRQIGAASAHWTQVASSGELSDDALKAAVQVRQTSQIASLGVLGIAFLSLVLFVGGALTLGSGLAAPVAAQPEPVVAPAMNVGTPPLPVVEPKPAPVENTTQPPAAAPVPPPEVKAVPTPRPEPRRTPRRTPPRATETVPAASVPSSAPAAMPPPAAAPAPTQPAPTTPN
jgi:outer membrane biosynthesis protein TonB